MPTSINRVYTAITPRLLLSLRLPHSFGLTAFGDLTQCGLLLSCTLIILGNATKSRGKISLFWALMALGFGTWLCAQVLWTYFEVCLRRDVPNPFVGDVILFLHIVPMMAALAVRPHVELDEHSARVGLLDFLLLLSWWLYLFLFVVIPWQYVYPSEAIYGRNFDKLYSAEHLVFIFALVMVWRKSAGAWRTVYANLLGAALLYACSSIETGIAIDFHSYYTGSVYDLPLVAAMAWFCWVAIAGRASPLIPTRKVKPGGDGIWAARLAMLACFSMPLMVAWASFGGQVPQHVRTYRILLTLGTMMAVGCLVVVRQHLLHRELIVLLRGSQQSLEETRDLKDQLLSKEASLQKQAHYDALTDLPNRTLLQDRVGKALASARRRGEKVALLFLDLDSFKTINDSLGHSVGDLVLKEAAIRLEKSAREQDTVARLGGDEFVVALTSVKDAADVAIVANRLLETMGGEVTVQAHLVGISCSIGISLFPDHGEDFEELLKNADAAMYCAKEHGNCFRFFTQEMNLKAVERLTVESSLRGALEKEEFFLVYQPQVAVTTGALIGAEALLRWRHPDFGLVPPNRFIPIAENSGLITRIGEWVLRAACTQTRRWQDEGLAHLRVAVNVSAVQFRQDNFSSVVRKALDETGLDPQYLELELTESLLVSNADFALPTLQALESMGVKLSIDDFGTGYSSLSYLTRLPVSKLKIDSSFVQSVTEDPNAAAITSTIISMGKNLNIRVIAEGVENERQYSFLCAHKCDEIQGHYLSVPLAPQDFAQRYLVRRP